MLTKDYTVEDSKDVEEYEKLVVIKNSERMKYRNMLEEEKAKINQRIVEITKEFDEILFQLFQVKIKYCSAINQEQFKIRRLRKVMNENNYRKQQSKLNK